MHALRFKERRRRNIITSINICIFAFLIFLMCNIYFNASGVYSKELNLIMLYPKDYPTEFVFHVSAHEIGHYVYFTKLTPEKIAEYEQLFLDSNEYVSEYSKTSAAENFAEEFAYATVCDMSPIYVTDSRVKFFTDNYNLLMNGDENI